VSETAPDNTKTTDNKPQTATKHKRHKSHRGRGFIRILILLVIIGLAGFGIWRYALTSVIDYRERVNGLEALVQAMQEARKQEHEASAKQLAAMAERQGYLEEGVSKLLEQGGHMRKDWLLSEAEYLIKLAGHRLLLERDIRTAIVALQSANNKLSEIGDPGIIKVRKEISKDISALQKIPVQDTSGVSLALSTLVQDVTKLPLRIPDPKDIRQRMKEDPPGDREAGSFKEVLGMMWQDLIGLFNHRKHDQPIQPMLQPEQRFFLVQNLQLKLEQARLAFLQNEYTIYHERLTETQKWIRLYFDLEHNTTRATLDSIKTLLQQELQADLPELTRSYNAIKSYREAGGGGRKPVKPAPAPQTKPAATPETKPEPATAPKPESAPSVKEPVGTNPPTAPVPAADSQVTL